MGDEAIKEKIRSAFQDLYETRGRSRERGTSRRNTAPENAATTVAVERKKSFQLQFTIGGKVYKTILRVSSESFVGVLPAKLFSVTTKSLDSHKSCVSLSIAIPPLGSDVAVYKANELFGFSSMIQANSPQRQCFDPMLVTNRNNPNAALRVSSADVLQILKTKLQYLLPNPYSLPIVIEDSATTKFVALTPFHVLRGGNPFYFKYGYRYPNLQTVLTKLPNVSWGSLRSEVYFKEVTYEDRIKEITNNVYEDDTPLHEVLRDIPFELESTTNEDFIRTRNPASVPAMYNDLCLSLSLLITIALQNGIRREQIRNSGDDYFFAAIHDPRSPEWIASSKRLVLTSFTEVAEGGKRKTRRRRRSA